MRRSLFALMLLAAAVPAADYPQAGLKVEMPDGWDRESQREGGATLFAAILPVSKEQQVRFSIEVGPGLDYDAESWLESSKVSREELFDSVSEAFREERDVKIGGLAGVGYTIAGKSTASDGESYDLHYRVCAVPHGGRLFEITQLSYNGAQKSEQAALDGMWNAIEFYEPKPPEMDWSVPPGAEARKIEDKAGNLEVTLPPGWSVMSEPSEDPDASPRIVAIRQNAAGDQLAVLEVRRVRGLDASLFTQYTPTMMLEKFQNDERLRYFDDIYGKDMQPRIHTNEGVYLAGLAGASASYEIRDLTLEQYDAIREAEDQIAKGFKNVVVPDPPKTVLRGRIAMLAPYIYWTRSRALIPTEADDETYLAELDTIHESFQLLSTQAKPPALRVDTSAGPLELGNTKDDPKYAEDRKDIVEVEAKYQGDVVDELRIDYVLPAGFVRVKEAEGDRGDWDCILFIAAQDGNNNWVTYSIMAGSHKVVSRQNRVFPTVRERFPNWKSNWEAKARGTGRIPDKPENFMLGNLKGKAYKFEGRVEGFDSSWRCFLEDKSGWRIEIEVETMANGEEVFKDGIKILQRKLRARF